jgi:hypothetical protein
MRELTEAEIKGYMDRTDLVRLDVGKDAYFIQRDEAADVTYGKRDRFSMAYKEAGENDTLTTGVPSRSYLIEEATVLRNLAQAWKRERKHSGSGDSMRDSLAPRQRAKRH